jgi:hypothetical protein
MQQQTVRSLLSRRHFLAGSAALAASTTLFGLDVDWAAPRGKEHNLLAAACSPEKLKQALIPQDKYRPFPTIHDRAWEGLRPQTRSTFLAGVEKSWHRTVKLDRSSNLVEISDSYILTEPVSDITLNLMTACKVTETAKGLLTLTSAQAIPPTLISFDANLLTPTVETIPLENLELKRNWGPQIYRIQLETPGTKTAGKLKLTISQHQ